MFDKKEKVFSLEKTTIIPAGSNLTQLFEELYGYLIIAGFYLEGATFQKLAIRLHNADMSMVAMGGYHYNFSKMIQKGLSTRYNAIMRHSDLNDTERDFMVKLDSLFDETKPSYQSLQASTFSLIAENRNMRDDWKVLAKYAGIMFGQSQFEETVTLPTIYLSLFGNIHLSRHDKLVLNAPSLVYGRTHNKETVTALYALLSAAVTDFCRKPGYAYYLEEFLTGFQFIPSNPNWGNEVTLPKLAAVSRMRLAMVTNPHAPVPLVARSFQQTLFGTTGPVKLIRLQLFFKLVNDMAKYLGSISPYQVLEDSPILSRAFQRSGQGPKEPVFSPSLEFAMEALDSNPPEEDEEPDQNSKADTPEKTPEDPTSPDSDTGDSSTDDSMEQDTNPADDDGGYDPSAPPPMQPASTPGLQNDSIGLISFNKTGEGIDEDLYRKAVLVLNDRLKSDDSVPVAADVKDALDFWVNVFLYRTAIKATQNQIANLKLQKYLKCVTTKG